MPFRRALLAICALLVAALAVVGIVRLHTSPTAAGVQLFLLLGGPWLAVLALRRRA
jgi:hypothetical protein